MGQKYRLNMEKELSSDPRLGKLAGIMGWHYKHAIGTLWALWGESQSLKVIEASAEDIIFWSDVTVEEEAKLIDALVKSRLIYPQENGKFRIAGNEKQVIGIERHIKKSKAGADARWEKDKENATGMPQASHGHATGIAQASHGLATGKNATGMPQASHGHATGIPQASHRLATGKTDHACECLGDACKCPITTTNTKTKNSGWLENSGTSLDASDAASTSQPKNEKTSSSQTNTDKISIVERAQTIQDLFRDEKGMVPFSALNRFVASFTASRSDEDWLSFRSFLAKRRSEAGRSGLAVTLFPRYVADWEKTKMPEEPKARQPHHRREKVPQIVKDLVSGKKPPELVYDDLKGNSVDPIAMSEVQYDFDDGYPGGEREPDHANVSQ